MTIYMKRISISLILYFLYGFLALACWILTFITLTVHASDIVDVFT